MENLNHWLRDALLGEVKRHSHNATLLTNVALIRSALPQVWSPHPATPALPQLREHLHSRPARALASPPVHALKQIDLTPELAQCVLIIPDRFKGAHPTNQAAVAIACGWRRVRAKDKLKLLPMSDRATDLAN